MSYEIRTVKICIAPEGDPLFSEMATTVEIIDDAGGEFLRIAQQSDRPNMDQAICTDSDEWDSLKSGIEMMLGNCRK